MKNIIIITIVFLSLFTTNSFAQTKTGGEKFGNTLNIGLGVGGYAGYYGYIGRSLPVVNFNYEFDVAKNFTLAPFISVSTYRNNYYWGNKDNPYRYYYYKQTIVPVGIKGTYYFDQLVQAGPKWDFYLAGSLGVAIISSRWENGYYGDTKYYHSGSPLFLDIHVGAEYHLNKKVGAFLDLSSGVSTIGLAIH